MTSKKHGRREGNLSSSARAVLGNDADTVTILDILSSLDTPVSLSIWLLYKYGEHDQLTQRAVEPLSYESFERFRDDYQATMLLSKSTFLKTTFDKKLVALASFKKNEDAVKRTNLRFRSLLSDPLYLGLNAGLLEETRCEIARILGDIDGEEIVSNGNWGPGVTTRLSGSDVSSMKKFQLEVGITRDCYDLFGQAFEFAYPLWWKGLSVRSGQEAFPQFDVGNKVITVPKNSKTDRTIAVEPGLNLWLQKALGTILKKRLRTVGLNVAQGRQELHCDLAKTASKTGGLATIDFSAASDTISYEVVRALLPPRWFRILDSIRSKFGLLDGSVIHWEKFSSMGNGFTFELETLIFFAAARAVCARIGVSKSDVTVFGDDVILPSSAVTTYSSFCDFLGFTVNPTKSFWSGYFRESCGGHFWNGKCVKPFFFKESITRVEKLYHVANSIRALAHRRNINYGCDYRLEECWLRLLRRSPADFNFAGSRQLGDTCFHRDFDEARPSRARHGLEGYVVKVLQCTPVKGQGDDGAAVLASLRLMGISVQPDNPDGRTPNPYTLTELGSLPRGSHTDPFPGSTYDIRGKVRFSIGKVLIGEWFDYGPWC